jgi:EmrB/QacA subfamily drug resistance transporter
MAHQTKGYRQRWLALVFIGFSLMIISLDNTVMNLALPAVSRDLGADASQLQWIVDAYILVMAGLLLTMGYLGDWIGRKPILQIGLLIFALFSLGAAFSINSEMLIGMRAMMGIGAATILPATLSILTATFREPKERAQAIAIWAAILALGVGIGPLISGWLLDNYKWNSVFYINIPIVIIGLVGGYFFIENSRSENPRRIDIPGVLLSIIGLFALVYAIIQAGTEGWAAWEVLCAFIVAAILLAAFVFWELRFSEAMLPIGFFKNMSFTGANVALMLAFFSLNGAFFFLGQFLQTVLGYSPLKAGLQLLPLAVVCFISAMISARIASRIGIKLTVGIGILLAAIGLFLLASTFTVDAGYGRIALAMCVIALGLGLTMSPATDSVMGSVPVAQSGVGSAMNNTTRQIGSALGIAILGTILNSAYITTVKAVNWPVPLQPQALEAIQSSIQGAHIVAQSIPDSQLAQMIINKANEAFVTGASHALVVAGIILTVASGITLIILPSRVRTPVGGPAAGQPTTVKSKQREN